MTFELDPKLANDTKEVVQLDLCYVGLMCDARFPWLILVPRKPSLVELSDLSREEQIQLMDETSLCTSAMVRLLDIDKINTAALGNVVRQLHVHVVGRRETDAAWPNPVWGVGTPEPYTEQNLQSMCERIRDVLIGRS